MLSVNVQAREKVIARNGVIDLKNWNWNIDGIANLNGNWEFYQGKFYNPDFFKDYNYRRRDYIPVPSFWNDFIPGYGSFHPGFGYATYRLKVLCPTAHEKLSLKLLTIASAYRLFINGKEVAAIGTPGTSAGAETAVLKPILVPVISQNGEIEIVIQVSNFNNRVGGVWDFIKLGTEEQIQSYFLENIALGFFVAGSFFLMAVYYFVLFLFFRTRYVLLFFSFLCFIIFTRSLVVGEIPVNYIFNWNWETIRRIEYISFYLSVPLMALFSYTLFPQDFSKKILYTVVGISVIFIMLSVFATHYIYTFVLRDYQLLMILSALYGFYVYIRAAWKRRPGSLIFLIGFCIFFITIINDILYADLIINTAPLFYIGLFVFVMSLSALLARQFGDNLNSLQAANEKLSFINAELNNKNNDIEEKNQQLTKLNNELDSLVYRTSHDLRAPIASVLGIVHAARLEPKPEMLNAYFDMQEKTLNRLDFLIRDIIDFSKNKRLELDLKEIDFKTLLQQSREDHEHADKALKIHSEVEVLQDTTFVSDPRRISMIINNLLSNAIKYSDETKDKQWMNIKVVVADNAAHIEVKDNGMGIAKDHLDKIFTMFYRATSSSTGSGLGLYILKETVEKLNGKVTIQSKLKEGTTATVIIPDMQKQL